MLFVIEDLLKLGSCCNAASNSMEFSTMQSCIGAQNLAACLMLGRA
jgi:hypothetical protein